MVILAWNGALSKEVNDTGCDRVILAIGHAHCEQKRTVF